MARDQSVVNSSRDPNAKSQTTILGPRQSEGQGTIRVFESIPNYKENIQGRPHIVSMASKHGRWPPRAVNSSHDPSTRPQTAILGPRGSMEEVLCTTILKKRWDSKTAGTDPCLWTIQLTRLVSDLLMMMPLLLKSSFPLRLFSSTNTRRSMLISFT